MKIIKYSSGLKLSGNRAVALGFFDGVHLGHRRLIEKAKEYAKRHSCSSAVLTFPAEAILPKTSEERLYSTEDKISLFSEVGIDELIIADFDEIKSISAEKFIKSTLIGDLNAVAAVCGKDYRFGKSAAGDSALLYNKMKENGRLAIIEDDVTLNSKKVSTSAIKEYLSRGDLKAAAQMLGSPFFISSRVIHGRGVGHTLGYPTLNTASVEKMGFLRAGVYASRVEYDGKCYNSLTNIGKCPTFGEFPVHAETFILDFNQTLYEQNVKIYLVSFIREEMKFSSAEALTNQIKKDVEYAKKEFNK